MILNDKFNHFIFGTKLIYYKGEGFFVCKSVNISQILERKSTWWHLKVNVFHLIDHIYRLRNIMFQISGDKDEMSRVERPIREKLLRGPRKGVIVQRHEPDNSVRTRCFVHIPPIDNLLFLVLKREYSHTLTVRMQLHHLFAGPSFSSLSH